METFVVGPESLMIEGVRHSLSSGEKYLLECVATGSRPSPTISWSIGDTDVTGLETKLVTSNDNNITTSSISLLADPKHSGQTITCTAIVPGLSESRITSSSILNVHFISSASLSLGSSMTEGQMVKEGDDVYLECKVESNPRPHKITWYKDGDIVKQDVSQGVILSNLTLVIQHVTRSTRGKYTCTAANTEGSVTSNVLNLDIQYKPVCADEGSPRKLEVGLNVQSEVVCQVEAAPEANLSFHWVFNTSQEMIDIQQDQMRVNGSVSTVDYIPRTVLDYGTLLCWAENNIGSQVTPCVFHLVPALPPPPISGCSFSHHDITNIGVTCVTQYRDSAKNITFILELWRTGEDYTVIRNVTSSTGNWNLDELDPGQEYRISVFTSNIAGVSPQYNSSFLTYQSEYAESRIHIDSTNISQNFVITPILGALIGVGVALSFVTITIFIIVYCRSKRQHENTSRVELQRDELLSSDAASRKELLAPRKILCNVDDDDDESGFEQLYSDRSYSSCGRQLCNKNIFIVVRTTIAEKC